MKDPKAGTHKIISVTQKLRVRSRSIHRVTEISSTWATLSMITNNTDACHCGGLMYTYLVQF